MSGKDPYVSRCIVRRYGKGRGLGAGWRAAVRGDVMVCPDGARVAVGLHESAGGGGWEGRR